MGILEKRWTQTQLRMKPGADSEVNSATASRRPEARWHQVTGGRPSCCKSAPPPFFQPYPPVQLAFSDVSQPRLRSSAQLTHGFLEGLRRALTRWGPGACLSPSPFDSKGWGAIRELCPPEVPVLVLFWFFLITLLGSFLLRVCLALGLFCKSPEPASSAPVEDGPG